MATYPVPSEYNNDELRYAFEEGYDKGGEDGFQEGREEAAKEFAELMHIAIDNNPEILHEQVEKITKVIMWGKKDE